MGNLVRFVDDLVRNEDARARFLEAPEDAVAGFDDITGEDVEEVVGALRETSGLDLATGTPAGADRHESATASAIRHLTALCASIESLHDRTLGGCDVIDIASRRGEHSASDAPTAPPVDPTHPSHAPSLTAVPDVSPRFGTLDPVLLREALPEHGVDRGASATVVAVHLDDDGELVYEIEVRDDDGHPQIVRVADEALDADG